MQKILTHIFITAFALMIAAQVVPGLIITDIWSALVSALVLGILNTLVRPILLILTFPITLLTFGLFVLIVNTVIFSFAANLTSGFVVSSFSAAFFGSLVVSIVSAITHRILNPLRAS